MFKIEDTVAKKLKYGRKKELSTKIERNFLRTVRINLNIPTYVLRNHLEFTGDTVTRKQVYECAGPMKRHF